MTKKKDIRQRILDQHKTHLAPKTRKPVTADELPTHFEKTPLMKYIELKSNKPIVTIIMDGTLDYVVSKILSLGIEIDKTTVSKWRARVLRANEEEENERFWEQFNN